MGGKRKKRKHKHFYEDIWDDDCLDEYPQLGDILCEYERKKIGKSLRTFIKWYKPMQSSKEIIKYLLRNKYKMYVIPLMKEGSFVSYHGKRTDAEYKAAPHFMFVHKDHSLIRIKPYIAGFEWSNLSWPSISLAIQYNPKKYPDYSNEAFKVTKQGEPIPKGIKDDDTCINRNLPSRRIQELMKETHLLLKPPTNNDRYYIDSFRFDEEY